MAVNEGLHENEGKDTWYIIFVLGQIIQSQLSLFATSREAYRVAVRLDLQDKRGAVGSLTFQQPPRELMRCLKQGQADFRCQRQGVVALPAVLAMAAYFVRSQCIANDCRSAQRDHGALSSRSTGETGCAG